MFLLYPLIHKNIRIIEMSISPLDGTVKKFTGVSSFTDIIAHLKISKRTSLIIKSCLNLKPKNQ
jgi:hypothetical protein